MHSHLQQLRSEAWSFVQDLGFPRDENCVERDLKSEMKNIIFTSGFALALLVNPAHALNI